MILRSVVRILTLGKSRWHREGENGVTKGATTLSITTLSIPTLNTKIKHGVTEPSVTQHKSKVLLCCVINANCCVSEYHHLALYADCHFVECHYAECHGA
jgi:hypothetical protein